MNSKIIETMTESIKGLAENIQSGNYIEENIKAIVTAIIAKLDLVSREEFDTQQMVLIATRKKLDELEQVIKGLKI